MSQAARALAICRKDVESYYAKPPLVTWGLLFPAVLMLALYVRDPETYLRVVPGVLAMTLLFGNTSMAAVVLTFEKRSGTLARLWLAPVTPRTILLGKALGAAGYGIATALVLALGLAVLLGMPLARPGAFAAGLVLGAGVFSVLGLIVAACVREVFEAMTLLNFLRFPLLFVSDVFMPLDALPGWLTPVAYVSPLTHVVDLMRVGIEGRSAFPSAWIPLGAVLVFLALGWVLAGPAMRRGPMR